MGKTNANISAVFWYVLLLAIVPAIKGYWTFLAFTPDFGALFELTWEAAYSALCIALLLLFLWRGKQRRIVFSAFVLTLFILYFYTDGPSLDRILSFVAYAALLGIALEFTRQNIPLYHELRSSGAGIGRILLKASLLWSPMLIFVFMGIGLNHLIVEWTKNALYASPFLDRHCVIPDDPDRPVIPCEEPNGNLRRDQLTFLKDSENIDKHVERMFFLRKKAALQKLSSLPPEHLDHEETLQEVTELANDLKPVNIFGLEPPGNQRTPDYRNDPQIRHIDAQLRHIDAQLKQRRNIPLDILAGVGVLLIRKREIEALLAKKTRLLKQRRSRLTFLEAERKKQEREKDPVKSYRADLYRDLDTIDPTGFLTGQLRSKAPPSERLAALKVAVVRFMILAEYQTRARITARLKKELEIAYDVGVASRLCRLTESEIDDVFECPGAEKKLWVLEPLPFRENIELSIERWHERSERDLEDGLVASGLLASKSAKEVKVAAENLWQPIPERIDLRVESCGLNLACHASNCAKQAAEDAYVNARTDLKEKFVRSVNRKADAGASNLNEQIDAVRSESYDALAELRRRLDSAVEEMAKYGAIASAALQLWLFLVIIKSVLYVIATEVFNAGSLPVIGLESHGDAEGAYLRSTNIEIPRSFETALQTTTVGINQGKKTVIPQPFRAIFSRVIRGKWMLNRGTHAENATMRFTQPAGRVGIDWQMQEGEEVVLRYGDLLGFSANVELRKTISLRLSTLLFGRYVYHSARCIRGPGRLLLSVRGDVEADQHKVETFPLERLVAWNKHAKFRVTDERTLAAVFKDGFTIRRVRGGERNGLVLVGAPTGEELGFQGTLRFVKTFLMPI